MDIAEGLKQADALLWDRGMRPLFIGIKGSTVYELPGTHMDLDVRAVFKAPTKDILSLNKPRPVIEHMEGELDFVGWEVEKFMRHLLGHNGNFVELLLTPPHMTYVYEHGEPLIRMAPKFLTKRLYTYYRGYAMNQFKRAQAQIRTGKGALYTYREMYAGLWLLSHGEIVFPWHELKTNIENAGIHRSALLDEFTMDRTHITSKQLSRMEIEFDTLNRLLDAALIESSLPETYDGTEKLNTMLLQMRSIGWT